MKLTVPLLGTLGVFSLATVGLAAAAGPRFYGDPPDAHHPWAVHDGNRPQPKIVTPGTFSSPGQPGKPPSDAIVLFDGSDLSHWESAKDGSAPKWQIINGALQVEPSTGDIRTKDKFGDCQLHIEWAAPSEVKGDSQGRGNSGIFLEGLVEIQVLDSYHNVTYADGHAAAVYGVNPPMVNAVRPPGEFQVYDIIFRRPVYEDGRLADPGYVTVFVNGVVAQDHALLEGPTGHMARSKPGPLPATGPLELQDHGNPMRFRNIWYRDLPPRQIEGGTDGYLTTEAAMIKRREIAASLREDAEHLRDSANPLPEMLRLMESLVYEDQKATVEKVSVMARLYVATLKQLPDDQLPARKDEVRNLSGDFKYLLRFNLLPSDFEPAAALDKIIKEQGWDKKKAN
jgi:prepilin-type processing-associated H-X9-DG protein